MAPKTKKTISKKPAGKKVAQEPPAATSGKPRMFGMSFARIYPLYVQKVEKKGRKKTDVDQAICWLTGYTPQKLKEQIKLEKDVETFFNQAPRPNPKASKVTGTVCGVVIEEIKDLVMRKVRVLDKLVDEIAKGKPMDEVLRK
ncbi:unnamed protein product [Symbiodinium sp. CCMP2456]|nr:unnamed protein product [Symbiodinium sp. CCMP2456]